VTHASSRALARPDVRRGAGVSLVDIGKARFIAEGRLRAGLLP
jgi:hypothetical protein